jgi:hypothetical protein
MTLQTNAAPLQGTNPNALRAQIAEAQARVAGLQAEYDRLRTTVQQMSGGDARNALQVEQSRVSVDISRSMGELARLSELGKLEGIGGVGGAGTIQPPRKFIDRVDPGMIVGFSFLLLMAFVLPLSIGIARRMMRASAKPVGDDAVGSGSRLDRLEQAVDSIAIEVERISEGQRYVTKLLSESAKPRVEADR